MTNSTKPTNPNPKDAMGIKKARWFSYIPLQVLVGVGLAMFEGARKYGKMNYRVAGVRASVYVDAAVCGHLTPWMEGQDIDPESGIHHLDKAIASLIVLRDGILQGNWIDDRPPAITDENLFTEANKRAGDLIEKHPDPVTPFTQKGVEQDRIDTSWVDAALEETKVQMDQWRIGHTIDRVCNSTLPPAGQFSQWASEPAREDEPHDVTDMDWDAVHATLNRASDLLDTSPFGRPL